MSCLQKESSIFDGAGGLQPPPTVQDSSMPEQRQELAKAMECSILKVSTFYEVSKFLVPGRVAKNTSELLHLGPVQLPLLYQRPPIRHFHILPDPLPSGGHQTRRAVFANGVLHNLHRFSLSLSLSGKKQCPFCTPHMEKDWLVVKKDANSPLSCF